MKVLVDKVQRMKVQLSRELGTTVGYLRLHFVHRDRFENKLRLMHLYHKGVGQEYGDLAERKLVTQLPLKDFGKMDVNMDEFKDMQPPSD